MRACYVHVPFCNDICAYCDFVRCRYHKGLANKWLSRMQNDIEKTLCNAHLRTMYIGGGTPSALDINQLERLLQSLYPHIKQVEEYTIEANIESFDEAKIKLCTAYGVNRVSLGVQSLQPTILENINRHHTKEDILHCIHNIRKQGIENISIDLIYGLPKQSFAMWKEDLKEVVDTFFITHISLYALTIEEHSTFGRNKVKNIDPGVETDMYEYAIMYLEEHGFEQYEISSFKKKDYASKHNLAYWMYDDFYGIGNGASGKYGNYRYDNTRNLQTYIEKGASPNKILLSDEDQMFEMLMMSLRLKQGIDALLFQTRYGVDLFVHFKDAIEKNKKAGLLLQEGHYVKTTYKGMLLLNEVVMDFL